MELTFEEAKVYQGLIVTEARRLAKSNGRSYMNKEDYRLAVENVAALRGECEPLDLQKSVMRTIASVQGGTKPARPEAADQPKKIEPVGETKKTKFVDLYRAWVAGNDIIPDDRALEHFTGFAAPSYLRSDLRKEGYEFEQIARGAGFRVTARPKVRTIDDILAELAEAIKSGSQARAASLLMELMEANKKQ